MNYDTTQKNTPQQTKINKPKTNEQKNKNKNEKSEVTSEHHHKYNILLNIYMAFMIY